MSTGTMERRLISYLDRIRSQATAVERLKQQMAFTVMAAIRSVYLTGIQLFAQGEILVQAVVNRVPTALPTLTEAQIALAKAEAPLSKLAGIYQRDLRHIQRQAAILHQLAVSDAAIPWPGR